MTGVSTAETAVACHLVSVSQSLGVCTISADGAVSVQTPIERGTTVERYVILERIGAGAMGVVYSAFDPRLDRQVAVKVLEPRRDRDELLEEARALAMLSHPNVVAVHDAGVFRDTVFITMERVQGQTFDTWLAHEGRRDWRAVLGVLLGAGRGLTAAHDAGSVHRDFKPANVMVDESGLAKVMDFGLAARASTSSDSPSRSRPEGTPMYMAPEQHMGMAATFASDQYAFCVVAYEALSGAHPRAGKATLGALLEALSHDPPPLSCPGLPAKVRAAIIRGLSADPQERWPSMHALLDVMRDALAGTGSRWLGAATLAGLGIIAWAASGRGADACPDVSSTSVSLLSHARAQDVSTALSTFDETYQVERAAGIASQVDRYAQHWAEAEATRCKAELDDPLRRDEFQAVANCLQLRRDDFEGTVSVLLDAEGVELLRAVDLVDALVDPRSCIDGALTWRGVEPPRPDKAERVAELRAALASIRARFAVGRWRAAEIEATEVVAEARELDYGPLQAEALYLRGEARGRVHEVADAERDLADAAWLALEHGDRRTALLASVGQVALRRDISQTDVNRAWARRARRLIEAGSPPDIEGQLELHLSVAERNVGNWARATEHARRAVTSMEAAHGTEDPRYAGAQHVLAAALYRQDDHEGALEIAETNVALRERLLGPRHPEVADALLLIGVVHRARGEVEHAEDAYRRALEIQTTVVGPRSRVAAGLHNNLSSVLSARGLYGEARAEAERAIEIWRELGHDDSLVYGLMSAGGAAFQDGDYARMQARYDEARELVEAMDREHPLWPSLRVWAAGSFICNANFDAAAPWLAVESGAELNPPTRRWREVWLAIAADHAGESDAARKHALEALNDEPPIPLNATWRAKLEKIAYAGT